MESTVQSRHREGISPEESKKTPRVALGLPRLLGKARVEVSGAMRWLAACRRPSGLFYTEIYTSIFTQQRDMRNCLLLNNLKLGDTGIEPVTSTV